MPDVNELLKTKRKSLIDEERLLKQKAKGKMGARERIELLFDKDTFHELFPFASTNESLPGDGVIVGYGKVDGRTVYASSDDFTVKGGTVGIIHAKKITRAMDLALSAHKPFISLIDSGGARIEESIFGLSGYGEIFKRNVALSGEVPQIAAILGPAAGGACYSPALEDFIFLAKEESLMFLTGPEVAKTVLFQDVKPANLGGWHVHGEQSGVAHFVTDSESECIKGIRKLLSYLPSSRYDTAPQEKAREMGDADIAKLVPLSGKKAYQMTKVIEGIADKGSFLEVQSLFARNAVTGFARIGGESVAIVANQPMVLGGAIDYQASDKIARFVRTANAFHLPIITFVDVPAFMPGQEQEEKGIIRHGAKILFAYAEASTRMVTIILRKAYGGAFIAMGSKSLGADYVYAWPQAEIAVMGAEGAIQILHRKEFPTLTAEEKEEMLASYRTQYTNPYQAENGLFVDEVICPEETRERIIASLESLKDKPYAPVNYRNMPL